jgi:hypothetical protein
MKLCTGPKKADAIAWNAPNKNQNRAFFLFKLTIPVIIEGNNVS